jgi:predicted nucleotidyltransferase
LKLAKDSDIAMDFATKVYKKMDKIIKSIILFGSSAKGNSYPKSDIDIMIILDDATIQWDEELVAWYREELAKIVKSNPYPKSLHVNTVRLTTWWSELIRGEPAVLNVIRWGVPLIDFGGFFSPLKSLMIQGKLKGSPEMIFITLGRAPAHMARAKSAIFSAMEALYWAFVDSSHAALIAAKQSPPSPEHITSLMRDALVSRNLLDKKYLEWYKDIYITTHRLLRGESLDISGKDVQMWRERADEYIRAMAIVVKKSTGML